MNRIEVPDWLVSDAEFDGRCFVIAEVGVNHNGDLDLARQLIDSAAAAGADAVKFQTWKTDELVRVGAPMANYQRKSSSSNEDQAEMLRSLELPYAWHSELRQRSEEVGLVFLSTPDEIRSANFLVELGLPLLKVGSAEITNLPYLRELSRLGVPIIMSTGMSTLEEVHTAFKIVSESGKRITLLHCTSSYPAPIDELNLKAIGTLRDAFGVEVGLSDHSQGDLASIAARALGIVVLEKHFTLDRALPGPDQSSSMLPNEFLLMVKRVREIERMLGDGERKVQESELETRAVVIKSICYRSSMPAGRILREDDFVFLRAGGIGLRPDAVSELVGRSLGVEVRSGDLAQFEHLVFE